LSPGPGEGNACCEGDCQPTADICGLPFTLLAPDWLWLADAGGSRIGGGPYPLGCDVMVGRELLAVVVYDCGVSAGDARGLGWGISLRR
jgi:hypothetical protein